MEKNQIHNENEHFNTIGKLYASHIIHKREDGSLVLSPFNILTNTSLLFQVAEEISKHIDEHDQSIIALGDTGIPLAVSVGLICNKPIAFYNKDGFPKFNHSSRTTEHRLLPEINDQTVVIIDSHFTTGYSSSYCINDLKTNFDIITSKVITPIIFDNVHNNKILIESTNYYHLEEISSVINIVDSVTSENDVLENISKSKRIQKKYWDVPPARERKKRNRAKSHIVPGLLSRPGWFIGYEKEHPIDVLDRKLHEKYRSYLESTDQGVWNFFKDINKTEDLFSRIGEIIDISKYEYIVGVGLLGTSAAIALNYYNQSNYGGKIIANLGEWGFLPDTEILAGKKVLPVQCRFKTGLYLVDTYLDVTEAGGNIDLALAIHSPPEKTTFWEKVRQSSLNKLNKSGVHLVSVV